MVLVANFSNTRCKIPKQLVVGYATRKPTFIILLRPDLSLVAHIHGALGLPARETHKLSERKPNAQRQERIATPAASGKGPPVLTDLGHFDGRTKAATPPTDWQNHVDLSDVENEVTRKLVMCMLEKQQYMCSGHIGKIKGPPHRIYVKQSTRPINQFPYRAGS